MKKLFIIALVSLSISSAFAQSKYTIISYSLGFGTGKMHDFILPMSPRGVTLDYREFKTDKIAVGLDIGWQVFYDNLPDDIYTSGNFSYSGKQYRYSNHIPVLFSSDYFINIGEKLRTFGGLGIGTMYTLQNTDMGLYTFERRAWHFAMRPELGILFKTGSNFSLSLLTKYYYGFKSGELPSQGYFTVNFGLVASR